MPRVLRRAIVASLTLLFLAVPRARAWNSIGHMAVAYAAYQQLTPAVKARVATLLALNPYYKTWMGYMPASTPVAQRDLYIFMMAATWPDEIKLSGSGYTADGPNGGDTPPPGPEASQNIGYTDMNMHKYWHFIDTPFAVGNLPLPAVPIPNSETEIEMLRAVISSDADDTLKSYDLSWLEHLVGDIHQPLHGSTRVTAGKPSGDAGGNAVKTTPSSELHAYWDDLLGNGSTANYAQSVTAAKGFPVPNSALASDTKVVDWSIESFQAAETTVYKNPPVGPALGPYTLTTAYHTAALALGKQRMALAGARLANLLNANLK